MNQTTPRRARKMEKRRQEILTAAKELFLRRSYLDVTVDEIADAADIAKATVYSHFKHKNDIYQAMILRDADAMVEKLRDVIRNDAPIYDNLSAMSDAYVAFFRVYPEYFEKLSWFYFPGREQHLSREQVEEVGQRIEAARNVIATCLKNACQRGEIKDLDVEVAALSIYAQWMGLAYLSIAIGQQEHNRLDFGKATRFASAMQARGLENL